MELVIAPVTRQTANQATPVPQVESQVLPQSSGVPAASVPPSGSTGISATTTSPQVSVAAPTVNELRASSVTRIESPIFTTEISALGARLLRWSLTRYRKEFEAPDAYEMVRLKDGAQAPLGVYFSNDFNDARLNYELVSVEPNLPALNGNFLLTPDQTLTLKFQAQLSSGGTLSKTFKFSGNSYLFDVAVELNPALSASEQIWLEWSEAIDAATLSRRLNPEMFFALGADNKLQHVALSAITNTPQDLSVTQWLSYGDTYFMAALVAKGANQTSKVGAHAGGGSPADGNLAAYGRLAAPATQAQFALYIGPKEYNTLTPLGHELHRSIDLGFFSFLAYPLLSLLRTFYSFLGNYGLAIILLTLLIKLLFLPLTQASFKSMRAMQEIQPEIKALRERIKDSTQLNQEMAALFKRRGVNPMGGCLPILIQIPVFFGLFSALMHSIELRHSPYALWITDLSSPEYLNVFGLPVPVLVLLWGVFMFLQQKNSPQSATIDPMQQKIFNFMPVMFTIMCIIFPMPSGLVLYWLVNIIISIIQQSYIRSDKNVSPLKATLVSSVGIFALGYVLMLI